MTERDDLITMIIYDNSNQFRIIFQLAGSVIPDAVPIGLFTGSLGLGLALFRKYGSQEWYEEDLILHPFAVQTLATVVGYLLCVRTNLALSRWMEGISDVEWMLSKWNDAYLQLNAFFSGKPDPDNRILYFRVRIAHWFALMSCLAFATLRGGGLDSLDDAMIKEMFPKHLEMTATRSKSFACFNSSIMTSDPTMRRKSEKDSNKKPGGSDAVRNMDLHVLANPTEQEVAALENAHDKVNLIALWIIQGTVLEVRAKSLDTPPPIVTRILQELSNGMLGFNQAHKVATVPFPFPFAQMVQILLLILFVSLPFYLDMFTQNLVFTPLISFVIPIAYNGLNSIAIELEEPFGTDWNDVDIEVRHEYFLSRMVDCLRQPSSPPESEGSKLEARLRRGLCRGHVEELRLISSNLLPAKPKPAQVEPLELAESPVPGEIASLGNGHGNASVEGENNGISEDHIHLVELEDWREESNREETEIRSLR